MLHELEYGSVLKPYVLKAEEQIEQRWKDIARIVEHNQWKVLQAFREHQVGEHHFVPSTGYGYNDNGRETLEDVYASVFGSEAAIVRPQIISGTHAISCCLFGLLRPGDELVYITGDPYDTLFDVTGSRPAEASSGRTQSVSPGSLAEFNISFQPVALKSDGKVDFEQVARSITPRTKMVGIQRSCGYADRPSFCVDQIGEMIRFVREIREDIVIFVDNCYGEFVEEKEPTHVGADLMAGSLIKNPGGGLAKSGGYIVGRKELVELVGTRLFAPGIGLEGGATITPIVDMYQGFFLAPHVVGEALKGAIFLASLLEMLGFQTRPRWNDVRTDLIQTIRFESKENLITFCQGIQKAAPVNAHVTPFPSPMPGYEDQVIMAGGTFIQGSSIEFSADGPIRPPYLGFVQGGLTFEHVKIGVLTALNEMLLKKCIAV